MAKQILATPVSTVAVDQQFSAGGNILDPKIQLKPNLFLMIGRKQYSDNKKKNMNKRTNSSKMSKQPAQKGATPTTSFVIMWFQLPINRYKNYVSFDFSKLQKGM